jgi:hypothetical protein
MVSEILKNKCATLQFFHQKQSLSRPDMKGQTLIKFKNISYGIYWVKYQDLITLAFWLNTLLKKAAPPYRLSSRVINHNGWYSSPWMNIQHSTFFLKFQISWGDVTESKNKQIIIKFFNFFRYKAGRKFEIGYKW